MTEKYAAIDELPVSRVQSASIVRIVDDDEKMLSSYAFMLGAAGWKVKCFSSAEAFLLDDDETAGCLVLDVRMPGMSGLQLQSELQRRGVKLPMIFVTGHGDVDMAVQTMKDGACDFMLKPVVPERLKAAVLHWCREDCIRRLSRLQTSAIERDFKSLSERERQVLTMVAEGMSNREIASRLGIAERTVKFHRASVYEKLGVSNSVQLAARAVQFRQEGLM